MHCKYLTGINRILLFEILFRPYVYAEHVVIHVKNNSNTSHIGNFNDL